MIWFWTSPRKLMDEEHSLMAALIRTGVVVCSNQIFMWRWKRETDLHSPVLSVSDRASHAVLSKGDSHHKKQLKRQKSNTLFLFLVLWFFNVLNLHRYHLSQNSITRPTYKTSVITISITSLHLVNNEIPPEETPLIFAVIRYFTCACSNQKAIAF